MYRTTSVGSLLEFSELVLFKGALLSFDDRSGLVFELKAERKTSSHLRPGLITKSIESIPLLVNESRARHEQPDWSAINIVPLPSLLILEGDGTISAKGMKIEWACEKDDQLYIGSFGKEFTGERVENDPRR